VVVADGSVGAASPLLLVVGRGRKEPLRGYSRLWRSWVCCRLLWLDGGKSGELEREGLSGEEGDEAMGVREKKMGCGVVVAAVFCVM
jgi:hypothetical protein